MNVDQSLREQLTNAKIQTPEELITEDPAINNEEPPGEPDNKTTEEEEKASDNDESEEFIMDRIVLQKINRSKQY